MEARARVENMENTSLTPHDNFFKLQMEVKEKAADFIQAVLPASLTDKLDFTTLEHKNDSFVDSTGGNFRADVIYECSFGTGQKVTVTLLLEHKSYREPFPHLQLLRYMLGIWDRQKKNEGVLRPIIPLIFYHGEQAWRYRSFESYFEGGEVDPVLRPFMPFFQFYFLNLEAEGEDWIEEQIKILSLKIALRLMQKIRSNSVTDELGAIFEGAEELLKSEMGRKEFEEISLYLHKGLQGSPEQTKKAMDYITFLNTPNPKDSPAWYSEQKGKAEGKAEAKLEVAKNLLNKGMDIEFVMEVTGLSREEIKALKKRNS